MGSAARGALVVRPNPVLVRWVRMGSGDRLVGSGDRCWLFTECVENRVGMQCRSRLGWQGIDHQDRDGKSRRIIIWGAVTVSDLGIIIGGAGFGNRIGHDCPVRLLCRGTSPAE